MSNYTIKNSFYELGAYRKYEIYAQKVIKERSKNEENFGGLYSDLVAVTFLGKLNTPILDLFPHLRVNLNSKDISFDTFINDHINEYYDSTWKLIDRYVKGYKIKHTSHPYYGRPSFRPTVKPFEEIEKITPENIKHKYKWFKPYYYSTHHVEKLDLVERVLNHELKSIKNEAENTFRVHLGLKPKTERWISEQLLFDKIKLNYKNLTIVSQASPEWLGRQRFDIYIPELNAAIEYNGVQHYKAVGLFGGKEGLIQTQKRDKLKRFKCKKNMCHLFEVKEGYEIEDVFFWINNIIDLKAANNG